MPMSLPYSPSDASALQASLSGNGGAGLVGHSDTTVADRLDAIHLADYTALRAYAGSSQSAYVTGYLGTAAPSGIAGLFTRDDSDTTSADNGGTIIVASNGKRWKRSYDGAVNVKWFGAVGDAVTNDTAAIQRAINAASASSAGYSVQTSSRGIHVHMPAGRYRVTATVNLPAGVRLTGVGTNLTVIVNESTNLDVLKALGVDNGQIDPIEIEDLAVVQNPGVAHTAGYAIKIDGNGFGTTPRLRNVYTYGTFGGIYMDWCFPGELESVHAFAHTIEGFTNRFNCTSTTFQNCYAGACGGSGFKITGHYTSLVNCASDSNTLDGYEIYYDGGAATGISLVSCGTEYCGRNGISEDRVGSLSIVSPRVIMQGTSLAALKFNGGDAITLFSPVLSAVAANANYAININNASGAYPSNVAIVGFSGTATNFAGGIDQPDYVWYPGSRTKAGMYDGTFRLGGIGSFTRALQTMFIGSDFPAGSGGTVYSANFVPVATTAVATLAASARYKPVVNAAAATIARLIAGPFVEAPTVTAGTVTRHEGARIADQPAGASADANLVLGDSAVPVGRWSICNTSTRGNLMTGPLVMGGSSGPTLLAGAGTPEGSVTAAIGSIYMRTDGGSGTSHYIKESGTGNTGWVAK